jgi:hypothetical protein
MLSSLSTYEAVLEIASSPTDYSPAKLTGMLCGETIWGVLVDDMVHVWVIFRRVNEDGTVILEDCEQNTVTFPNFLAFAEAVEAA